MSVLKNTLAGIKAAILGGDPSRHMDVSRAAFPKSFYALGLAGIVLLLAGTMQAGGSSQMSLPIGVIVLTLFLLTAPTVIYLVCHLISRPELFRPWIIVRNWITLLLSFAGLIFVAIGVALPVAMAIIGIVLMLIYITTLLLDIRLAQTMAGMEWTPAIFIACAISIAGMLVILAVFASLAGY